jgi:hypothetical protein
VLAPYAFLGAKYDPIIKEIYVRHSTDDLFRRRNIFSIVGGDSVTDVSGFIALIKRYLPDNLIDEIAVQNRLGRELLIGTTNLDSERPVTWNIGAIANSDHPGLLLRKTVAIGTRSLNSLMRTQGLGDLYRIYTGAERDGIDFNLAYIPDDFVDKSTEPVDTNTMMELYNIGQSLGRNGYAWRKVPPGAKTVEPALDGTDK